MDTQPLSMRPRMCVVVFILRSVSGTGCRYPISTDRVPAVAMNSWRVARHYATGVAQCQNGVDVKAISNLAIGFPLFSELEG